MKKYTRIKEVDIYSVGADPELFIEKDGKIVGAEHAIPKDGLTGGFISGKQVIIDGVLAELNPGPASCRATFNSNIQACITRLNREIKAKGFNISEQSVAEVSQEEMDRISEENKKLGCAPSFNNYNSKVTVNVNKDNINRRCAGGHIHLACRPEPEIIVPILDLFVGNTCVLIDRDPMQVLRRQQYGRAGEYRLPDHGFEYRTLSNFWLRSHELVGLVTGLCRLATKVSGHHYPPAYLKTGYYNHLTAESWYNEPYYEAIEWLAKYMDVEMVEYAINQNDFDTAMRNWKVFRTFIKLFIQDNPDAKSSNSWGPMWPKMIPAFEHFVKKGIDYWWPCKDVVKNWEHLGDTHGINWEAFITGKVVTDMKLTAPLKTKELVPA